MIVWGGSGGLMVVKSVMVVRSMVDLRAAHITFWDDGTVPYVHRVIVTQVTFLLL